MTSELLRNHGAVEARPTARGRSRGKPSAWGSPRAGKRGGLTLTEVLMSILVTGIGVMSVIVLLPLSFVRAVQATNLTNATILRYNAESVVNVDPIDFVYVFPFWTPNTNFAVGQTVVAATDPSGNNHFFQATAAGTSQGGVTNPPWVLGGATTDNTVTWNDLGDHSHYVIDPLGALVVGGPLGTGPPAALPAPLQQIPRFGGAAGGGTLASVNAAAQVVALPDNWVEQARVPITVGPPPPPITSCTFFGASPPSLTMGANDPPWRVVLLDASGKQSQTRILTSIAGAVYTWDASQPLPAGFTPALARVEIKEQRYSWMLTVRRNSNGQADVDVTVFFRRPLSSLDEQVYDTNGGGTQYTVNYTGARPFAKKGSYLFDISFGRWYRVVDIPTDTGTQLTVEVDRQRPVTDGNHFGAVFMRGIVDVYPIGNE